MTWKNIIKREYQAGDYVTYKGLSKEQIRYAGDDPFGLEVGETYQLESVDVQNWKTYFTIKGIKGRFNSVGFELGDELGGRWEEPTEHDIE
tara:strand:+ start:1465 stop:1737 length:273 start_codon:yes stop_codon:yes gene_type:complete